MINKRCPACNKKIRHKYNYCWDHRHLDNKKTPLSPWTFHNSEKAFIEYKSGKYNNILMFSILILFGLSLVLFVANIQGGIYVIIIIILLIFCGPSIRKTIIETKIRNRSKEFTDFIKEHVSQIKEEKRFQSSLLQADKYIDTQYD